MIKLSNNKITGTILVVDDQDANRKLLKAQLAPEGHEVFTAEDGESALEEFVRIQPDLVLSDVKMRGLKGFDVCRALKLNPETRLTPVVLITGNSAVQDRIEGISAGAADFLTKPVERTELLARVQSLLSLKMFTDELERAETVLLALANSIEARDTGTAGHCERLSDYSVRLGRAMGLTPVEVVALRRAGAVHDIGKIAVPDAILLKPARLTREEMTVIEQHPVVGERICAPMKSFALVLPIIRHHHEKRDGTGYPDGLKGEEIPLSARILQIVDVYDALVTARPYRGALSREKALNIIEEEVAKGWWDPDVFTHFARMIEAENPTTQELVYQA